LRRYQTFPASFRTGSFTQEFVMGCPASRRHARLPALPVVFGIEFFELCPHRRKPLLKYTDDLIADLGRGEGSSVYESAPSIDLILSTDDHLIGIAIHND
jgi:hypothetical protein